MGGYRALTQSQYRPEIDGLRAIAVLAVMLYHAGFSAFGGGYTGVDIFFVISGYLITGIIARGLDDQSFTWTGFIERRARRILPALFVMLAACVPVAWWFLLPDALESFSASLGTSALFVGNLYFWRIMGGYFGLTTDLMPLRHLWSLAVEEQYYLLFPPLLMLARWFAHLKREALAMVLLLASLVLCAMAGHMAPAANFYLLPMRAWEFLAGGLLALREMRVSRSEDASRRADAFAFMGVGAIIAPVFLLDQTSGFPWPWALPTVVGTALFIAFAHPSRGAGRMLALPPFVGIGLISYSAYLWHQPLIAFSRVISLNAPTPLELIAVLGGALGLATLSWRTVEQPFRQRDRFSRRAIVTSGMIGSVALATMGGAGWITHGAPERLTATDQALATMNADYVTRIERCMAIITAFTPPPAPCITGRAGPVRIAVLGDSHAAAIEPAVTDAANGAGVRAIHFAHAGCPPVLSADALTTAQQPCPVFNDGALCQIVANRAVTTVILAARWTAYIERSYYDNGEGGVELGTMGPPADAGQRATIAKSCRAVVDRLRAAGKRVILIYPIPEPGWDVPRTIVKAHLLGKAAPLLTTSSARFRARNANAYAALDAIGARPGLTQLYPARALCDTAVPGRCITMAGFTPLYFDDDHLSAEGARFALAELQTAVR